MASGQNVSCHTEFLNQTWPDGAKGKGKDPNQFKVKVQVTSAIERLKLSEIMVFRCFILKNIW